MRIRQTKENDRSPTEALWLSVLLLYDIHWDLNELITETENCVK